MSADMDNLKREVKELKKNNSYLLDRLDKAYSDKMMLRQENIKSKQTVNTVKDAVEEKSHA
jgi:hypothetical protein